MSSSPSHEYAGDLELAEAWALLSQDPKAQLIDVRTIAEWNFVGLPDLSELQRRAHCIEWQRYPAMQPNPNFTADAAEEHGLRVDVVADVSTASGLLDTLERHVSTHCA